MFLSDLFHTPPFVMVVVYIQVDLIIYCFYKKSTKCICITSKIPKCSVFPTLSPELNEDGNGVTPDKLH